MEKNIMQNPGVIIGISATMFFISRMVLSPIIVYWLNKYIKGQSYTLCVLMSFIEMLILYTSENIISLFIGRIICGAFSQSQSIIMQHLSELNKDGFLKLSGFITIGFTIGSVLSSFFIRYSGVEQTLFVAIIVSLSLIITSFSNPLPNYKAINEMASTSFKSINILDISLILLLIVQATIPIYLSYMLVKIWKWAISEAALAMTFLSISSIIVQFLTDRILAKGRINEISVLYFSTFFGLLAFLFLTFSESDYFIWLSLFFISLLSPLIPLKQKQFFSINEDRSVVAYSIISGISGCISSMIIPAMTALNINQSMIFVLCVFALAFHLFKLNVLVKKKHINN